MPKVLIEFEAVERVEAIFTSIRRHLTNKGIKQLVFRPIGEKDARTDSVNKKHWSLQYDRCIVCGTNERKHMGQGLCTRCYFIGKKHHHHKSCHNPTCPYDRGDYREQDMVERNKHWYCCEECATSEVN